MTTLVPPFLNGSFLFLQVTRIAWISLNFVKITSPTLELAALEGLINQ